VSRSGYYDWLLRCERPLTGRAAANAVLVEQIHLIHARRPSYGSPRMRHELLAAGHRAGVHRVARLMRAEAIRARRGRSKHRGRTAPLVRRPDVGDLVRRRFHAPAPDRLWCTDVTQIATGEGWVYAAVVLDVYSRKVISWSISHTPTMELSLDALRAALRSRRPAAGLIVHSDRGAHYTSAPWINELTSRGMNASIGERGSALDNAMIESWFSAFKQEALYPTTRPATRAAARLLLFEHIHFHNTDRRHSALAYLAPDDYERLHTTPDA
jgi:putative transposase